MAWIDFDFLGNEPHDFSMAARDLVLQVFNVTTETLKKQWAQCQQRYLRQLDEMTDEGDIGLTNHELEWEEQLHRQRMQGVGSLALDWLMSLLQATLDSSKRYFDKGRPRRAKYDGKGWLARTENEYQQRFGVDFQAAPSFNRIQELVLARNAGIHRETSGNLATYVNKIQEPRFIDRWNQFWVTEKALQATIEDVNKFVEWLVAELKQLRPAKIANG